MREKAAAKNNNLSPGEYLGKLAAERRDPPELLEITDNWYRIDIKGAVFFGHTEAAASLKYWDYMRACSKGSRRIAAKMIEEGGIESPRQEEIVKARRGEYPRA